mgnify:CR=1 FL=1
MITIPTKSAKVWNEFIRDNKVLILKYSVRQVKKAIEEGKTEITLYKVEGTDIEKKVSQDEYIEVLSTGLDLFISTEEYEYAEKTKQLIIDYQINNLIQETSKPED